MADVIRERQYVVGDRRADDIEVHERRWWQSNGLLLALLGLLALALLAMFLYDRGRTARTPVVEPSTPGVAVPAEDIQAPMLTPPPTPPVEGEPAMAPPPPPEEQNITPPVVPVPEEKTDAQKGDEKTAEGQKTDAEQLDIDKGDVTKRDVDKGDVTKRDIDKGDVDKGQQETAEQPKTEMEKDVDKGTPMTAEKKPQPAPAKPQQPGQTGPLTAPEAAPAAPAAAAMAESGKGCRRLDIYFNPQSMNLTDNEKKQIDALAECLRKHPGTVVKFEGRSDGVELSNGDMLAKDRAQLIADELEARGIKECRFVVVNAEPSCTQNDFACRRQNRSVSVISDF